MENWLNYVKTKYVVTDIADESIVYETIVEGDIRNVIMPSDIIRSRKDYRLSIYLETDDEQINSKLSNKLLASLVWNSSALKLTGDDGINLGDLVTTDIFQTTINNILNQLNSMDLSQYYKKDESHAHFVEDVVHIGDTPPDDTNMLWYDTSDTSYAPDALKLFNLKGTVNDKSELPATGVKDGDVYKVTNNNGYVVFNNGHWDVIGYEGPVVIASYDEPTNKNVIWYDLNEDGPSDTNSTTGNLADNFRFRCIRDPNEPSRNDNITKLINYSNATIEYKAIKEEITRAFKDISIRAPLNISVNYFPQYEQLRNINTDAKDFGIIPLVKSVEFLQEPDFSSTGVRYSNTILPLLANVRTTGQIIPIKVTMFDGSSKEFNLALYLYRNPLESVTTNYVERIEVPISQVWNGNVPDGTEFTGTLFYFGPELVIGYHPHGGEATYRHKFTLPVMSVENVDEYIGLVGNNKFHDLEPEAMNKVIQDMNLSFIPKTTIKNGKLVLFIPGGMTGTRKIAMDQPISGSDIYITLKKDGVSKEFVLKRYEDYNTQDFTNVNRYGFDIVKMDLLTLINKDYDRKNYDKVTTLANPLSKYIGCFLQGNGASSTGTNTDTGFLYFNNFTGSVFHNIREVTPNTTDIKNLSLSSGNVMWYNKFVDQTVYTPLLKNSKKQSQCSLNVEGNIELITLPSDGNKKLFIQITQPQHNINTGTKLYRIDIPLSAFTALGLPVPAYVIERVSNTNNVDFSDYYNKTEINNLLENVNVDVDFSNYYDKATIDDKLTNLQINGDLNIGYPIYKIKNIYGNYTTVDDDFDNITILRGARKDIQASGFIGTIKYGIDLNNTAYFDPNLTNVEKLNNLLTRFRINSAKTNFESDYIAVPWYLEYYISTDGVNTEEQPSVVYKTVYRLTTDSYPNWNITRVANTSLVSGTDQSTLIRDLNILLENYAVSGMQNMLKVTTSGDEITGITIENIYQELKQMAQSDIPGNQVFYVTKPADENFIGKTLTIRKAGTNDSNSTLTILPGDNVTFNPVDGNVLRRSGSSAVLMYVGNGEYDIYTELP